MFWSHSRIADSFPCSFRSWLRPPPSCQRHYLLLVLPESLMHLQAVGLILNWLFVNNTTLEQVMGSIPLSMFSWKSLCLITTIKAQFLIRAKDTKRAFKSQSSGLQLPCQNYTFSLNARSLHSYSTDKSVQRKRLMEPHTLLLTGFILVFCM